MRKLRIDLSLLLWSEYHSLVSLRSLRRYRIVEASRFLAMEYDCHDWRWSQQYLLLWKCKNNVSHIRPEDDAKLQLRRAFLHGCFI